MAAIDPPRTPTIELAQFGHVPRMQEVEAGDVRLPGYRRYATPQDARAALAAEVSTYIAEGMTPADDEAKAIVLSMPAKAGELLTHMYGCCGMVVCMKTTVEIADALLEDARRTAEKGGTTVRALIEEGLRLVLKSRRKGGPFRLRQGAFAGKGLHPDIKEGDWDEIRRRLYENRGA